MAIPERKEKLIQVAAMNENKANTVSLQLTEESLIQNTNASTIPLSVW